MCSSLEKMSTHEMVINEDKGHTLCHESEESRALWGLNIESDKGHEAATAGSCYLKTEF